MSKRVNCLLFTSIMFFANKFYVSMSAKNRDSHKKKILIILQFHQQIARQGGLHQVNRQELFRNSLQALLHTVLE